MNWPEISVRQLSLALVLGACLAGPPANAQNPHVPTFGEADFGEFTGFLPSGDFAFAAEVSDTDNPAFEMLGLAPGMFITRVQIDRPGAIPFATQGPREMIAALADLRRGDRVQIDIVHAETGDSEVISYAIPSERELAIAARKAELQRQAELARTSALSGDPFGQSYWGSRLRLIALGAFDLARVRLDEDAQIAPDILRFVVGDRAEWLTPLLEAAGKVEARLAPNAGLFSAYGITRSAVIGSCGEPQNEVTQIRQSWIEYQNGLGQYRGQSDPTTKLTSVIVPSKFVPMVHAAGDVDVSFLASVNLEAILLRMSCNDPWRVRLEDNMLEFYRGAPPHHSGLPE